MDDAESTIDAAIAPVASSHSTRPDAKLIVDEFTNAAELLRRCVDLARKKLGFPIPARQSSQLIIEHRRLWLARNRPGGLDDSLRRLFPLNDLEPAWRLKLLISLGLIA